MPDKKHRPLLRIGKGFENLQPAVGSIQEQDIVLAFGEFGRLALTVQRDQRQELQRKFCLRRDFLQFPGDALLLVGNVLLGMEPAPGPPARLLPSFVELAGQNRLDFKRYRWSGLVVGLTCIS